MFAVVICFILKCTSSAEGVVVVLVLIHKASPPRIPPLDCSKSIMFPTSSTSCSISETLGALGCTAVKPAEDVHANFQLYCTNTLWPLLHNVQLGEEHYAELSRQVTLWEAYQHVNAMFAEHTCSNAGDGTLFWVHNFQLMLVPLYIRQNLERLNVRGVLCVLACCGQRSLFFLNLSTPYEATPLLGTIMISASTVAHPVPVPTVTPTVTPTLPLPPPSKQLRLICKLR